jgi:hypothetical protein
MVESDVSLDEFCELDGITCTGSIDAGGGGGKEIEVFLVLWEVRVRGVVWTNLTRQSRPLEGED